MNGQLWQECRVCGAEPVCADCERCKRHCTCEATRKARRQALEIEREDPGFWHRYIQHTEDGKRER